MALWTYVVDNLTSERRESRNDHSDFVSKLSYRACIVFPPEEASHNGERNVKFFIANHDLSPM